MGDSRIVKRLRSQLRFLVLVGTPQHLVGMRRTVDKTDESVVRAVLFCRLAAVKAGLRQGKQQGRRQIGKTGCLRYRVRIRSLGSNDRVGRVDVTDSDVCTAPHEALDKQNSDP